jgi:murein DD-endopeptidase MepM/ murein hydrolase activator NlpD
MLDKKIVSPRETRSLLPRQNHLNMESVAQLNAGFTTLTSKKFNPYLFGIDPHLLKRDLGTTTGSVKSLWKKLVAKLYSARVLATYSLVAILLLFMTGSARPMKLTTPNQGLVASGKNSLPMTVSIIKEIIPTFKWPLNGQISTNYSRWHPGIDVPQPKGTPVKPIAEGTVSVVENSRWGYGKSVIVTHTSGYASRYAHLSTIEVKVGDKVTADSNLGQVGSTGRSTGNHLHMEIYANGKTVNPVVALPAQTKTIATDY